MRSKWDPRWVWPYGIIGRQKNVEYILVVEIVCGDYSIADRRKGGMGLIRSPEYYGSFRGGSSECLRPALVWECEGRGREGRELFRDERIGSNRAVVDRLWTLPPACDSSCLKIRSGSGLLVSSKLAKRLSDDNRLESVDDA